MEENKKIEDNVILVGRKPFMNYAYSGKIQFEKCNEIIIKARGNAIYKAVDLAEFFKRENKVVVEDIQIGSETMKQKYKDKENGEEKERNVDISWIEIKLKKN